MCLCGTNWSAPLRYFWHNTAHVNTRDFKTVCMGKWIHSSHYNFYLEFLPKKRYTYSLFMIPLIVKQFKCDLSLAVSTITVRKVSGDHRHLLHCHSTWTLLEDVEECLDLLGHFCHLLSFSTGRCSVFSVSVWETNLGLQATKPVLFPIACESLQNCTLCQIWSAGQIVNW